MNNDLQSEELKLIGIAHTNIAKTHPLKAIGKLSEDVVAKVKRRLAGQDA
jgi:hypothetical protein